MKTKYSLVLPCFNEFENLELLLPQLLRVLKNKNFEIILVDDNSEDQTIPKLKKIYKKKILYTFFFMDNCSVFFISSFK